MWRRFGPFTRLRRRHQRRDHLGRDPLNNELHVAQLPSIETADRVRRRDVNLVLEHRSTLERPLVVLQQIELR